METYIKKGFDKRIFTFYTFIKDFIFLICNCHRIISAVFFSDVITKQFREKIMSIVTSVNGCTYCSWFHAKVAVSTGLSEKEVKGLMKLQFKADASDYELKGLLYAQHFAETNRNIDLEMKNDLYKFYGKKTANQIIVIIRLMFFTNLQGNTFDAFISRLKGIPAKNSNVIFEFFFFIINVPLILPVIPFINNNK